MNASMDEKGPYENPEYVPVGDKALLIELGDAISPEVNKKVRSLFLALRRGQIEGIQELVPAYRSLMIYYEPGKIKLAVLKEKVRKTEVKLPRLDLPKPEVYKLPVLYGGEGGPDIDYVSRYNGLTTEEVIEIHTSRKYLIYMIGFTPGFPYLGDLPEKINTPRLAEPRREVPAGSVGIADRQTGIYPTKSPGGWRIIGKTPVSLYNPDFDPPVLFTMGDYIKFFPIHKNKYERIKKNRHRQSYRLTRYSREDEH